MYEIQFNDLLKSQLTKAKKFNNTKCYYNLQDLDQRVYIGPRGLGKAAKEHVINSQNNSLMVYDVYSKSNKLRIRVRNTVNAQDWDVSGMGERIFRLQGSQMFAPRIVGESATEQG